LTTAAVPPPLSPPAESLDSDSSSTSPGSQRRGSQRFFAAIRWLHIYLSLLGFTALAFFSATGLTLNHPTWFGAAPDRLEEHHGHMNTQWLSAGTSSTDDGFVVDKLAVVEFLRSEHRLQGAVAEFRVDDAECLVTFKGPGYAADAFIDRGSGRYDLTISQHGAIAILNDLHKGRDSGRAWSLVIDLSALLMLVSSITGLVLLLSLKRRRTAGLVTAVVGTAALVAVYAWLVP
jgi:hypothetical protein